MRKGIDDILEDIYVKDPRYCPDAYEFILDALSFSQKKFKRVKHVSGKELLEGIKVLLMEEFGPMTMTVLKHWKINSTEDFGNMVFNLIKYRVLSKNADDSIEDFRDVYDFNKVFESGYRHRLYKKVSRLR